MFPLAFLNQGLIPWSNQPIAVKIKKHVGPPYGDPTLFSKGLFYSPFGLFSINFAAAPRAKRINRSFRNHNVFFAMRTGCCLIFFRSSALVSCNFTAVWQRNHQQIADNSKPEAYPEIFPVTISFCFYDFIKPTRKKILDQKIYDEKNNWNNPDHKLCPPFLC